MAVHSAAVAVRGLALKPKMPRPTTVLLLLALSCLAAPSQAEENGTADTTEEVMVEQSLDRFMQVQKCCPEDEMMVEVRHASGPKVQCRSADGLQMQWAPDFLDEQGRLRPFVRNSSDSDLCAVDSGPCIAASTGVPECGPVRAWPIFTYADFQEGLQLRPYGVLRHVVDQHGAAARHFDYSVELYCVDAVRLLHNSHLGHAFHGSPQRPGGPDPALSAGAPTHYALICEPGPWDESGSDYLRRLVRVAYPLGLGAGLAVLLVVVGVHLLLKELRDLSGCMLTALCLALVVSMASNLILAATDRFPSPYVNSFVLEMAAHSADVAVHFWLNAIGHRAWTAVRYPRKEAMRPEGRRLGLYSAYAWGASSAILGLALAVDLLIDWRLPLSLAPAHTFFTWYKLDWLALALFCSTCVFLLLANIYLYVTTRIRIGQQTAYGRTFHRNKGLFQAFTRLLLIIESVWLMQTLSWLQLPVLVGLRVVADIALPFLILWASMKGRRVLHLIKIRLQVSQCWPCRRWLGNSAHRQPVGILGRRRRSSLAGQATAYYGGEEMVALGTPI